MGDREAPPAHDKIWVKGIWGGRKRSKQDKEKKGDVGRCGARPRDGEAEEVRSHGKKPRGLCWRGSVDKKEGGSYGRVKDGNTSKYCAKKGLMGRGK